MNFNTLQRWSLKSRVTLFTLSIFIIGIWSLAFYTNRTLQIDMEHLMGEQQLSTASYVAAEINEGLSTRIKGLELVASAITPVMLNDHTSLQKFLDQRDVIHNQFNGGVFALLPDGVAIADSPLSNGRVGVNFMDRKYAIGAIKEGKATIGIPVIGKALKSNVFSIAVPIRDAKGKVIGALAGTTDLARPNFLDKLTESQYGKTGGYLLVSPENRLIITATDKSRIMQPLPAPGVNPYIDRNISGFEGNTVLINPIGVEQLASVKRIPVAGWYVAVAMPTEEAFFPIREMQLRLLVVTLVLTLIANAVAWWMLKLQLSPMLSVAKALTALSNSNQAHQPLPIISKDEVGELIGGFNHLLKSLEQQKAALKASEESYSKVVQDQTELISRLQGDGIYIFANEAFLRFFDKSEDELIGSIWNPLVYPDDLDRVAQELAMLTPSNPVVMIENRVFSGIGKVHWMQFSNRGTFSSTGQLIEIQSIGRDITDQKRIQVSLSESESRFRNIFENAPIGMGIGTLEGKFLQVNNAFCAMFGYTKVELEQMKFEDITHPDDLSTSTAMVQKLIDGEIGFYRQEKRYLRKDGQCVWATLAMSTVSGGFGLPKYAIAQIEDITERKRIEKELIVREREFRTLAENAPDNIVRYDTEGRIVYVNPQLEATLGVSASEVVGKTPSLVAPDGSLYDLEVTIRRAIASGKSTDYYLTLPDIGKGERFHHLRITPERDEYGEVSGVLAIGRDITERKRSLHALEIEIEKSRALLRNASDGIHILDADGKIIEVSDSFCAMLGYRREEMIGMNVFQWDDEIPYDERIKIVRQNLAQKFRNQFETRHRRKDGTIFDVEISTFPLELDGQSVLYCSSRDISERKKNEIIKHQLSDQIRDYSEMISDLYDHAPCGYHSLDNHGFFMHINETELKWLGYTRYEIIGKRRFIDLLPHQAASALTDRFAQFKKTGKEQDVECSLIRKDGTLLPVMISSLAVYGEEDSFIMSRSTVYDMTERKKMEGERMSNLNRLKELSLHLVAAQEEARRQLSSELHDRTSPNLAAISINLDIISNKLPLKRSTELSARLEDTRALILDTAASIREIGADLRPPLLDYAGLAAALESHLQQFMRRTGIVVEFDCENSEERLKPELESMLFRIVQEALTNCAKHAHAKTIRVTLYHDSRRIVLTICDDGIGFIPSQLGKRGIIGLGVLNMREMAEIIGGSFTIDSEVDLGTTVTVEICLSQCGE